MRTYKHLMAIALIALASSAGMPTTQAQAEEQENYAWITNTNGMTWKRTITHPSSLLVFDGSNKKRAVAQIVVPEHSRLTQIDVRGCANLTNLVFKPTSARRWHQSHHGGGQWRNSSYLTIRASGSGLLTIAMRPQMIRKTRMEKETSNDEIPAWLLTIEWTTNWQAGDPPKMEIRTTTTQGRQEVEVVWRTGNLQLADAVNGEWKDYHGINPYRFPLVSAKDMQFFRIKPEEQEEPEENQGTPPQPEK